MTSFRIIAAQGYYAAVDVFGCESWIQSQQNVCTCIRTRRRKRPNFEKINQINKYEIV